MEFGILGPLQVLRDGVPVEPGSPKQRALLVNLIVHHGRVVPRDRLIEDLWAGSPPSTGLGVLQNYISQLRKLLGPEVVVTRGSGYALHVDPAALDSVRFERLVEEGRTSLHAGEPAAATDALRRGLLLWRGPALADVAGEGFALAELSRLRELRAVALELDLEAEIAGGRHREAVARLQAAVVDQPFRERLWWLLMLALYRSGLQAEALRAFQRARTVLADELGLDPGGELRDLERAILDQHVDLDGLLAPPAERRRTRRPSRPVTSLLGRAEEWATIQALLRGDADTAGRLLLLTGEPGIGKTRLLEEARIHVASTGGLVVGGRAFEAEHGRSYGAWVDALRGILLPAVDASVRRGLAPLLPELSDEPAELDDPSRLYDAVVHLLRVLATQAPVAVLLDDVQWLDEPSASLLHFAIRHLADADVAFLAAARPGEADDNEALTQVIQALRRDNALTEVRVGPLQATTIVELTARIAPGVDGRRIAEATNGNPLFALEMARAVARGEDPHTSRVDALIADRLARLDDRATALVPWIAAFGRGIPPAVLGRLVPGEPSALFDALGKLERHGVVHADEDGNVDFVHDLVRTAAYQRLSSPRRTMLHSRIAGVLAALADPDDSLAADTARHAGAGGESATCAAACVRAARRCLRLLAYADAEALVALGRSHARRLFPVERVTTELHLVHVLLHPGVRLHDPGELTRHLSDLCAEAQRLGLRAELSLGLSLLARAHHWGWGDMPRARMLMQRAAQLIDATREPNPEPLLEAARCMAYLELDMERTARLFDDLGALDALAAGSVQYQWGAGLVAAWRGDIGAARAALGEAIDLASARGDHWATFECTARLALLELESGAVDRAGPLGGELAPLAGRLGEGSEPAYASAVHALCGLARQEAHAVGVFDRAIGDLQLIDAAFLVPDLLGLAAELQYRAGDLGHARRRATEAARLARQVSRPFEAARAHALLACIAAQQGDVEGSRSHLDAAGEVSGSLPDHVEGLRRHAEGLLLAGRGNEGVDAWP